MPASARPSLSACVITLDEADRIEACLDSLAFCDEVVVVDSGSTDGTRERAAAKGARVIEHAFQGYRAQKDFAVLAAAHDWVLCLDADERVTPALRASIERARDAGFADAVNVTLGLPIIRTSVDHGTALDLAGTGKAGAGSLVEAVKLAAVLVAARRRREQRSA